MSPTLQLDAVVGSMSQQELAAFIRRIALSGGKPLSRFHQKFETVLAGITTPFCFITSKDVEARDIHGGVTVEASPRLTARLIAEDSHRFSTPEEIEQFKKDQAHRDIELAKAETRRPNSTASTHVIAQAIAQAMADQGRSAPAADPELIRQITEEFLVRQSAKRGPVSPPKSEAPVKVPA